jgi:hypothetical protein
MEEQLFISLVERQRCAIEFCVRLGKNGSETLQLIHQAYGDDAMRRIEDFKWWRGFRDGSRGQDRLFHYPPEAYGKRSAARFREVGGALSEMHGLPRDILQKWNRHRTPTKFRLGIM